VAAGGAGARGRGVAEDTPLVVFMPSGRRGRVAAGTTLLEAARALGADVDSVCGGRSICGRCQVVVAEGAFAKHGIESRADNASPPSEAEGAYADRRGLAVDRRLACQAQVVGDLVIDVPAESQVHKQVIRKRPEARAITVDPVIKLHYVEVAEPCLDDPASDLRRLDDALREQWGIEAASHTLRVVQGIQSALREGDWTATVAVRNGTDVFAVWPGYRDKAYGVAVDVGSTTIAAHLTDLATGDVVAAAGVMNPQIRFGEDLMSRVSYVMMNPGGERELTAAVRGALDDLIASLAKEAEVAIEDILDLTVVGNPIMHHLLLGIDPTELGGAPFALAVDGSMDIRAADLGLHVHHDARVFVLPCIAGHVGADAAAVVLSEGPHLGDDVTLVVDVGTNAEIVLGNRDRLLAASSPTGPAFEGAQISAGQRATAGAIERVRIDRDTLEPRFRVIGAEPWSDKPGFAEAVARSGVTGICGSGIIEVIAELFLAGVITSDGRIDGALASRTPRVVADGRAFAYVLDDGPPRIAVTQNDVRAIQLAKAALFAGARLLMDRLGIDAVDRIVLAGAFGSQIDVKHATVLGMIPDCDLDRVSAAGNAAGTGARIALVNRAARSEIDALVRRIEKVETAVEPAFQAHFVDAMAMPHGTLPFPRLAAAVELPSREMSRGADEGGQRRRRRSRT